METATPRTGRILHPVLAAALIVALAVIPYANTFHVPFLFDDLRAIVENADIKDPARLWPPSGNRWFGYLTFALNYAAGGIEPAGYHAVNLAIHAAGGLLVLWLVLLILRTPFFRRPEAVVAERTAVAIALLAAALFVSHPVQTQAVTYIVQRFASLAAMLYLLSVCCFLQARLAPEGTGSRASRAGWYVLSLLAGLLAMKTKETAFTLPVIVILADLLCFPPAEEQRSRRAAFLAPYVLLLLVIPLGLTSAGDGELSFTASATSEISRADYLATQFRVIVIYLRLLAWPAGQMLDYDLPVSRSFGEPAVLLSFAGLLVLFGLGCWLIVRAGRKASAGLPGLAGFGILWFFITLAVESSVIPIADVIFEHRLYLPSAGAFIAAAAGVVMAGSRLRKRWRHAFEAVLAVVLAAIIALQAATFLRNRVWQSEVGLWEDVLAKNPLHAKAQAIIGLKYLQRGGVDEAIRRFRRAIELKPGYAEAHVSLGNAYLTKGWLDEGYREYQTALAIGDLDHHDMAQLTMNIGTYYLRKRQPNKAIQSYRMALGMMPGDAMIHHNLGLAYEMRGMRREAEAEHRRAHQLNPERY